MYSTDQSQPNRKQTQTKPWVYFRGLLRVYTGFISADPELTLSKPRVDMESKPRSEVDPENRRYMCICNIQGARNTGGKIEDGSASHFSAYNGRQKQNPSKPKVHLEWTERIILVDANFQKVHPEKTPSRPGVQLGSARMLGFGTV